MLLTAMRKDIADDVIEYRVINPSNFAISHAATIQIYKDHSIMFISIGDAFFDFFESLSSSELVYNKEYTLQLVDDCLKRIDELM